MRYVAIAHSPQAVPRSALARLAARLTDACLVQDKELATLRASVCEWWIEVDEGDQGLPVKRKIGFSTQGKPIIGYPFSKARFPTYGGEFGGPEGIGKHPYPTVSKQAFEAAWEALIRSGPAAGS
jgi:hypothetical protein